MQQEEEETWTPKTEMEIKYIIEKHQSTKIKPKCKISQKEKPIKNTISQTSSLKEKVRTKTERGEKTILNCTTIQVIFLHLRHGMKVVIRPAVGNGRLSQA